VFPVISIPVDGLSKPKHRIPVFYENLNQFIQVKRRNYRELAEKCEMVAVAECFKTQIVFWEETDDGHNIRICQGGYKPSNANKTVNILVSLHRHLGDPAAHNVVYHFNSLVPEESLHVKTLLGPSEAGTCPYFMSAPLSSLKRRLLRDTPKKIKNAIDVTAKECEVDFEILNVPRQSTDRLEKGIDLEGSRISGEPALTRPSTGSKFWDMLSSDVVGENTPQIDAVEYLNRSKTPNLIPWVICFFISSILCVLPSLWGRTCSMHPSLINECRCTALDALIGASQVLAFESLQFVASLV
jgi:hypothetical protein